MAEETTSSLKLVTDWNQVGEGVSRTLDLTEDAWTFGPPPPRGVYDLKCLPAKECAKWGLINPKDPNSIYYNLAMECKIVSDEKEYDGIPVFGSVTTRVYRGKENSTAAALLQKMGFKVPQPVTDKKLAMLVIEGLKKERIVKAELDWRGAYSYKDPKTGEDIWENVFNHYEEFPIDPLKPDIRKHVVSVAKPGGSAEVRAQLRIVRFFGKGDEIPVFSSGTLLVSGPRSIMQPQPVLQPPAQPTPQLVQQPQPQFVQPPQPVNAVPAPSTGTVANDELELLLQE